MAFDFNQDYDLWHTFSPGFWQQDIMTFPLEGAVDYLLEHNYTHRGKPLFPFNNESRTSTNTSFTPSVTEMTYGTVAVTLALFAGLDSVYGSDFDVEIYPRLSGYFHTFGWTAVMTSVLKNSFQRKRPFYDTNTITESDNLLREDRKSFVSGHVSQAFAFATYTTMMIYDVTNDPIVTACYGLATHVLAGYIGYTRIANSNHDIIDVIGGGLVGSALAFYISLRTSETLSKLSKQEFSKFTLEPNLEVVKLENNQYDYGVNIHAVYRF